MTCESCYALIEALNQAQKNSRDLQEIAKRYENLYMAAQKDCEAMSKLVQLIATNLKSKLEGDL